MRAVKPTVRRLTAVSTGLWIGLTLVAPAAAQDGQYWTNQVGNRARLLGGAVVGESTDLSSVYYNPGGLSLNRQPELLLSGNVVEYSKYTVEDADIDGGDLSRSSLRGTASLFAGELRPSFLGKHRLAYSFLQRQRSDLRADAQASVTGTDILDVPNLAFLSDDVRLDRSIRDNWYGITWSYPVAETIGVGVSTFAANRTDRLRIQNLAQGLGQDGRAGLGIEARDHSFGTWRMLWKAGVQVILDDLQIGMSLTTPSVGLTGDGDVGFDSSLVTQDIAMQGSVTSEINTNAQDDLKAEWRSPFSIGVGASYPYGATSFHMSAEWFDSVSRYTALQAEPFVGQTSGETIPLAVEAQLDSVFNMAFGVAHEFSEDLTILGGFHTDFSAAPDRDDASQLIPSTKMNLYHFAAGAQFRAAGTQFTTGLILAFGDSNNGLFDTVLGPRSLKTSFSRATFILGFDFDFGT